jgi:3',5'-cyclic AMP phosphodiesterase CpdA
MSRLAHLSDLHFGSDHPELADALADDLNRRGFDLVIISGDLTLAARHREFRAARAFIDRLEAPTLIVPGNHDITPYRLAERFAAPYRRWKSHVGANLEPTFLGEDVAVFGINTARRMLLHHDWSRGSISRRQIRRLGQRLAKAPADLFRIVVAHHPFLEEVGFDGPGKLVKRAQRALKAFTNYEIDLIASGHLHRTYTSAFLVEEAPEVPEADIEPLAPATTVPLRRDSHRVTVIQAGTAISHRTRGEENSYNEIDIDKGRSIEVRHVVWTDTTWVVQDTPLAVLRRNGP